MNGWLRDVFSRLIFMSPWMVITVFGYLVVIMSIICCRFFVNSLSLRGGLYMLMIVWVGSVLCLVEWICVIIVCAFWIVMSSIMLTWRFCL